MSLVNFDFDTSEIDSTDVICKYFSGAEVYFKNEILKYIKYANGDYIEFNKQGKVVLCVTYDGLSVENRNGFMSFTNGFKLQ